MIAESNYIELMKNCSKWNTRIGTERRNRFRVPYFEQQTGTAHRLVPGYYKTKEQRYASDDPNVVAVYPSSRWRKRRSAPSDAIEMKMFLRDNPALDAAINSSAHHVAPVPEPTVGEVLTETLAIKSTTRAQATTFSATRFDEFGGDLDDEASNDDAGSDEEDWGSKRRGKQHHHAKAPPRRSTTSKKASVGVTRGSAANTRTTTTESTTNNNATTTATSVESQSDHSCPKCRAKYKSLAGLSYHNAYVHNQPLPNAVNKLLSPSVEASDFCDLCLGNRYMNKKTKQAEDLVTCHDCGRSGHPSCLQFNSNVSVVINRYGWQCIECKSCTCCALSDNDDQLLFCDDCDRGYHLYCLNPPLKEAPDTDYSCRLCQKEFGDKASAPAKE